MSSGVAARKWIPSRETVVRASSATRRKDALQGDDEGHRKIGHHVVVRQAAARNGHEYAAALRALFRLEDPTPPV